MKKVNYHQITLFLTISFFFQMQGAVHGQTQLSLSPNPTLVAQCPNTPFEYIISNFNASCHTIFVEQAAAFNHTEFLNSNGTPDPTKRRLFITWFDQSSFKGKITITKNSDSQCNSAAGTKIFDVPIKSLNNLTPTLTPAVSEYNIGLIMNINFTAYLEYPMRGPDDPNPMLCNLFTWTIPEAVSR